MGEGRICIGYQNSKKIMQTRLTNIHVTLYIIIFIIYMFGNYCTWYMVLINNCRPCWLALMFFPNRLNPTTDKAQHQKP